MNGLRYIILITTLVFNTFFIFPEEVFEYLSPQEGLPNGSINDIAQDSDGVMWFATWDGLISYDGATIKQYRPRLNDPESLPNNKTRILHYDSNDNLWVVTDKEVCVYNPVQDNFDVIDILNYSHPHFGLINLTEFQNLIILHTTRGLYYYDLHTQPVILDKLPVLSEDNQELIYFKLLRNGNNQLLLASFMDEQNYNTLYSGVITMQNGQPFLNTQKKLITETKIHDVLQVPNDDNLFLGTEDGLYNYDKINGLSPIIKNLNINKLTFTSDYKIWIGSKTPGIIRLDLHTGRKDHFINNPNKDGSLLSNIVYSLFEDFSHNLWIGHGGEGLSILNLHRKAFDTYRHDPGDLGSLSNNSVFCFSEGYNKYLIGTRFDGINSMQKDEETGKYTFTRIPLNLKDDPPEDHLAIWDIKKESDWVFWIGGNMGLVKLVDNYGEWKAFHVFTNHEVGMVRKLFLDPNKNLWFGTFYGLYLLPSHQNDSLNYFRYLHEDDNDESLTNNVITEIFLDSKDQLWIGTYQGLNRLKTDYDHLRLAGDNKPNLRFERFIASPESNSLNNNEINCIYEYQNKELWIGTQGGGINIYDHRTRNFRYIDFEDGLPGSDVFGILPDEQGKLWLSTENGLASIIPNIKGKEIASYDYKDGLQGNIFVINSYFKSSDGRLFFGGRNGFTAFYPDKIKQNTTPPRLKFTSLRVFNKDLEVGDSIGKQLILSKPLNLLDTIILPYNANTFGIGVASIHYQDPKNNGVLFKIDELDTTWTYRRVGYYAYLNFGNLPTGDTYTLRAKAISSDNTVSQKEKTLTIIIDSPWWQKWYVRLGAISILLSLLIFLGISIMNRQRYIYRQRIDQLELENKDSKLRYLTNISHELRTPLSLVTAPIEYLLMNFGESREHIKSQLQSVHRNSQLLMRLINQIIDFSKLNAGKLRLSAIKMDLNDFIKDISRNFEVLQKQKNIRLSIEHEEEHLSIWADPQKLEEIMYNLLSNAFKNTRKEGIIYIKVEKSLIDPDKNDFPEGFAKITVFNEGKIIPKEKIEKVFERFYTMNHLSDGAGIGLAFTKSLVELHHGYIHVENIEDRGVTFSVYLPMGHSHLSEEEKEETLNQSEVLASDLSLSQFQEFTHDLLIDQDIQSGNGEKLKIVVVEDSIELRSFFKKLLSVSYQYSDAEDGESGLKLINEVVPDLIICDVMMPGMDGFELTRKVKENINTCHIPVLMLTAKSTSDDKLSGFDSGADAYVVKPFNVTVLLSQLNRLIKNRELIRNKYRKQNFMIEFSENTLSKDDMFIKNVNEIVQKNMHDPDFNVNRLSEELNLSTTQTYRKIKALTGYNSVEFIKVIRLNKAAEIIQNSNLSIKEVCFKSGYNNFSYFVKSFRDHFGVTPAAFRDKQSIGQG